jgi:LmbE family N-acetylglucosaminyl deacetylase
MTYKVEEGQLRHSAIIFAPHPDDETLGCGGTILKKKQAKAEVKIVFMTDGRQSHGHLIEVNKLISIRAKEALAASQQLGLTGPDIIFLEFEDGQLHQHRDAATQRVIQLLSHYRPDEVFIPYSMEPPLDHSATNEIVLAALRNCRIRATVYEYPIWFWHHWPWVNIPIQLRRKTLAVMRNSFYAGLGLRLLRDFRYAVYIGDVIELKRTALEEHKSQMSRLIPHPDWATLGDVSNGQFLKCFFQEYEIFRKYNV